jgi:hypothetical protein
MSGQMVRKFLGEILVLRPGKSNVIDVKKKKKKKFGLGHCQGVCAQFPLFEDLFGTSQLDRAF